MAELKHIRLMNDSTIKYLIKLGEDTKRNEEIGEILKDETCFFKMEEAEAKKLLKEAGVSDENINTTYEELTSKEIYYRFQQSGKIKIFYEKKIF